MTYLAPPNNSLAHASAICGSIAAAIALVVGLNGFQNPAIFWLGGFLVFVLGTLAIIFGFIGISTGNRLGGRRKGRALWGTFMGFLTPVWFFIGLTSFTAFGI